MNPNLHIISFDIPYPPSYGGIIDVYFKIKALAKVGVKIHLHIFGNKSISNSIREKLLKNCSTVHFYPRKKIWLGADFISKPYIVSSRKNEELIQNLRKDEYPILFEGIHTTAFICNPVLKNRLKLVRTHNIEHDYYRELARTTKGIRKRYFLSESRKLKKFEKNLICANFILSIAKSDVEHFSQYSKTIHLPAFFNNDLTIPKKDSGDVSYLLFHGNLAVSENENAARILINQLAKKNNIQLVIAGANPTGKLKRACANHETVDLISNPSESAMIALIAGAQINILIAEKPAGVKLKLLNTLQLGKHIIINKALNDNGMFSNVCRVAEINQIPVAVEGLRNIDFNADSRKKRKLFLSENFNNLKSAGRIRAILENVEGYDKTTRSN